MKFLKFFLLLQILLLNKLVNGYFKKDAIFYEDVKFKGKLFFFNLKIYNLYFKPLFIYVIF